jgi:hypothetical protein
VDFKLRTIPQSEPFHRVANLRIKEQFRGLRWINLRPEHLNYQFTQILFIGEKSTITGEQTIDQLEMLEDEDEARVNHLKGKLLEVTDDQARMLFSKI